MEDFSQLLNALITKHLRRILIFLFTMMVGMAIGVSSASAQTRKVAATPSPTATLSPAKNPVPITLGTIVEATEISITITDESNQKISFKPATPFRIEAPGITGIKTKPTIKNLAINDRVAIISADKATTPLVVLVSKGNQQTPHRRAFLGVVSSREATSSGTVLSLKHPSEDQFAKSLVATATKIAARTIEKPTQDDIKAGDKVLVVGGVDTKETILARTLYLIPGKARSLIDKVASPAATPKTATGTSTKSPVPSGSAKATPSATKRP